jgi:hypothetical protein
VVVGQDIAFIRSNIEFAILLAGGVLDLKEVLNRTSTRLCKIKK